jgi:hypothetical protein
MDDFEDEEALLNRKAGPITSNYPPIKLFGAIHLIFPKSFQLTLFNWKRLMIVMWGIQMMFFVSMAGLMKPDWALYVKLCIITAVLAPFFDYAIVLLNMYNGGWGQENSRFWCHMRIMYLSGYNSIRWSCSAVVDPSIVLASSLMIGETFSNAIRASISVTYCYYILAQTEREKSTPIEWDKFKDDFDVRLDHVNDTQMKNMKTVGVEPIVLCCILSIIPWIIEGYTLGFFIMIYQLAMCVNAYRYCSSLQTFVVTDTQYDIIQTVFRIILTWSFIWI